MYFPVAPGYAIGQMQSEHITEPYPGGESYLQAAERVRSTLEELAENWDGKRVLVIGHSATRWALDHLLNDARLEDLVEAPLGWKGGWVYRFDSGFKTGENRPES